MFIAFDGIDGSGKSTQVQMLDEYLTFENIKHEVLDFGGNSKFKSIIKNINTQKVKVNSVARELLYLFEGLYTNIDIIQPRSKDEIIIIDRYYLSYFAYGQLNGLPREYIAYFTKHLVEPDLYFYIDIDPEQTYERIAKYRELDVPELGFSNYDETIKDKEEKRKLYIRFQSSVRDNYLKEIKDKHHVLCGNKSSGELNREVIYEIQNVGENRF